MSHRKTQVGSGVFKPVVGSHYRPSQNGKVVTANRKATMRARTTHPTAPRAPEEPGPSRTTSTPSGLQGVTPTFEFDDAGYADDVETEPVRVEAPTEITPNILLRAWKAEQAESYLHALYARDAPPGPIPSCSQCMGSSSLIFRCEDCTSLALLCQECLLAQHKRLPFHRVLAWSALGQFWKNTSLYDLGMVLHLGHGGEPCCEGKGTSTILVGHTTGFYSLKVMFCGHDGTPKQAIQLLRAAIMPCTDTSPKSAFTLAMLDHFTIFSTLSKTSTYSYYSVLKRLTNTGFPGKVSDRYRQLLQAQRKYNYLMALKRAGTVFDSALDKGQDHPANKSLSIDCVACPRPGINFNLEDVPPAEKPFFRFWFAFDGNFRNPRKAKKVDVDDICLTDGRMYYVSQAQYQDWLKAKANMEPSMDKERPECDNHKAATDKYVRWGGLDVTGFVDFHKGERFANVDYAIASTMARLLRLGDIEFGITYDIWCHWEPKFGQRAANFPAHLALPLWLKLVGGVPKFHIQGHSEQCRIQHSLNYKSWVGRIEGEGCERAWAHLNQTAGSTSEKSPGARWDSINYIILDWNFEKTITIAIFLVGKFREAAASYQAQKAVFVELNQSLPGHLTATWRNESIEPVKGPNGKWTSPFFGACDWGQGVQEVLQQEQSREEAYENEAESVSSKRGLTKWISKAIELENTMDKLRHDAQLLKPNSTPHQHNLINDRRKLLLSRIQVYRQERERYMGSLGDPDHDDRELQKNPDPEYAELGLPSSYNASSLIDGNCIQAPKVEGRLRRAACDDALRTIRNLLGAKSLVLKYKRRNVAGEIATTRMEVAMRDLQTKVQRAHCRYNRSRNALLRLDLLSADHTTYLEIKPEDQRMLSDYLETTSVALGQGEVRVPWIWRSSAVANDESWQKDALRVEWFRARQRYLQWEEELKILKREMVMALKSFQHEQRLWEARSSRQSSPPGFAEYARRRTNFFEQLSIDVYTWCDRFVRDPVVHLGWATSNWPDAAPTARQA